MAESENTPTPTGSDADSQPSGDGGASRGGSGGGTDSGSDAFEQERATLEARARDFQGKYDSAQAEIKALNDRLAKLETPPASDDSPQPLTREELTRLLDEREQARSHAESMAAKVAALQGDDGFKYADKSLYARAGEFDSPEALEAAVKASHEAVSAVVEESVTARLREAGSEYGIDLVPPADPEATPQGDPTIEQLERMSDAEWDALEEANPGVIDRVFRSATATNA